MPNQNTLPVIPGTLPQGFCPATWQDALNGFSAQQNVTIPASAASIQVSATKPGDTTLPWQQLDSLGRPTRIYVFAQGAWLSLHTLPPGFVIIWTGALPDTPDASGGFPVFDGGDANARSPYSGPMWQLANTALDGSGTKVFDGRAPMGVGTFPSGATIAQGDKKGEDLHKLTVEEMPPHTHKVPLYAGDAANHADRINTTDETDAQNLNYQSGSTGGDPTTGNPPTAALGHNTLPPIVGVYFLQRTSRLYYTVN